LLGSFKVNVIGFLKELYPLIFKGFDVLIINVELFQVFYRGPSSRRPSSVGSTIADLLNETFDSEDSELRNLVKNFIESNLSKI
jgi:hypothetical protein